MVYFHTKKYVPGLHELLHALKCQAHYKHDKPWRFSKGRWSPRALKTYNSLDSKWKKIRRDYQKYKDGEISKKSFIMCSLKSVGKTFVNVIPMVSS